MTDEVETYTEIRLSGQPDGDYPPYDMTFRRDQGQAASLLAIWAKIRAGTYKWADAKLETREVTVTRTPWEALP